MKKEYKVIASKGITNTMGIGILSIEYGIADSIIVADFCGEKMSRPSKCKIRTNMQGDAYFIHYGRREYLSEYIRHDV